MNIIAFQTTFGRFTFHFEVIGALALGFGLNFFPNTIGFGISLGPFIGSISYSKPNVGECPGGVCHIHEPNGG